MSLLQAGFGSSGDDYEITDSLRFRSSASAYLNRTPSSTSDRTEWTWSGWVKKGPNATNLSLFSADHAGGSNAYLSMLINNSDEFQIFEYTGSAYTLRLATNALFRDPSAWYHFVCAVDTDQGTDTNRIKLYVNGVQQTSLRLSTYPSSGHTTYVNVSGNLHAVGATVGASTSPDRYLDGYLTEVNFIDGQQLTPSDFGEFDDNGTWKPLEYEGTYGTNGFYLPMTPTTQATGFNTLTYAGSGVAGHEVSNLGFSPDLVWIKQRSGASNHILTDTIRGVTKTLISSSTSAELTVAGGLTAFNADGFTLGIDSSQIVNTSGQTYVAWCWDAGSGSAGTNTDGDINSTVKANTTSGFSVATATTGSSYGSFPFTIGHGLGTAPAMVIYKSRGTAGQNWWVWHKDLPNAATGRALNLNLTGAEVNGGYFASNPATATTMGINSAALINDNIVMYSFAEVAGYSKFGTYTGNGSAGNSVTGLGFQPAWLMIKCSSTASTPWVMYDNTREPDNDNNDLVLQADNSSAELDGGGTTRAVTFDSDGFTLDTTYGGNNGSGRTYIYMAFADTADARFNFDASGNQNNWEPNNINSNSESETTYDLMKDTPSLVDENAGNFAVINPLVGPSADTFSEGNLKIATSLSYAAFSHTRATIGVSSGKWYWEVEWDATSASSASAIVGITTAVLNPYSQCIGQGAATVSYGYRNDAYKFSGGSISSYGASYTVGDVIGVALDLDAGTLAFYKNGAAQGTAYSSISGTYFPGISDVNNDASRNSTFIANFGQRPFAYTPPSGFLKLNTFNLPDSTIEKGDDYFNTVLYTGTSAEQAVTVGFQPDFTWIKQRNGSASSSLADAVRGAKERLFSDQSYAESTYSAGQGFESFDTDGFTVNVGAAVGTSGNTYVSWNWLASNTTATNSAGANGAAIASTYSANTTSGFSVVSFTGTGANTTVFHGLGTAPKFMVIKSRTTVEPWLTYHGSLGGTQYLFLNQTSQANSNIAFFNNTNPTSAVFSLGNSAAGNTNAANYIAYCFAEVPGYSAFGSYEGNANNDGPFVYTGFRPSFLIVKSVDSTSDWLLIDNKRIGFNPDNEYMEVNNANAEGTVNIVDFVSNGFKLRDRTADPNVAETYIYLAFAENPFKNSNAR